MCSSAQTSCTQLLCFTTTFLVVVGRSVVESRTYGFDIHHLFSDPVKSAFGLHDLPEERSVKYYATMVNRDRSMRERRLAAAPALTFPDSSADIVADNYRYSHYVNISVGEPSVSFLVALATSSFFSWLPCNCFGCLRNWTTTSGETRVLNIYDPARSKSRRDMSCSNSLCFQPEPCFSSDQSCLFDVQYPAGGIFGNIVEDNILLVTDDAQTKPVYANIAFGCAMIISGSFSNGLVPNGVLGLGRDSISTPTMLASQGYVSDSFSLCFGPHGGGKIFFGDKGSSDQAVTPFNLNQSISYYNISITQVSVSGKMANISFTTRIDSSDEFSYLSDPQYSLIAETYNKMVKDKRYFDISGNLPFEYCYEITGEKEVPSLEFTMQGGSIFRVISPTVDLQENNKTYAYCLGIIKVDSENGMAANFMKGYRIVFDRERNVLGWKAENCSGIV